MDDIFGYNEVTKRLRDFFQNKNGFIEVPAQTRKTILAACEDPATIGEYNFGGVNYALPQTGQMELEKELLKNPDVPGVFCITTSYRNEPDPQPGRHDLIFPMFEYEKRGDMEDLKEMHKKVLKHLGLNEGVVKDYEELCKKYKVESLTTDNETDMIKDYRGTVFIQNFPQRTSPFWNMKHSRDGIYSKVDVILASEYEGKINGMETFGSAERSTNTEEMRQNFYTISDGKYADLLFSRFGKKRVEKELDEYLSLEMFPRFGAGIGITRLAKAMYYAGIIDKRKAA